METTVTLQKGFSYSVLPIIILAVLVLGIFLYVLIRYLVKYRKPKPKKKPIVVKMAPNMYQVKIKYLARLDQAKMQFDNGDISVREAYQLMSGIIREFIASSTGINVTNYSLQNLRVMCLCHILRPERL